MKKILKYSAIAFILLSLAYLFIFCPIYLHHVPKKNELFYNQALEYNDPDYCSKIIIPSLIINYPDLKMKKEVATKLRNECFFTMVEKNNDTYYCRFIIWPEESEFLTEHQRLCLVIVNQTEKFCNQLYNEWESECSDFCSELNGSVKYNFSLQSVYSYCECLDKNDRVLAQPIYTLRSRSEIIVCGFETKELK